MAIKHTQPLLKLRIEGPGVRSGAISVPDLVRICQATQDAVSRQAEAMRGGQSLRPGPKSSVVYQECTLELTGIKKGSTVLPFALAGGGLGSFVPRLYAVGVALASPRLRGKAKLVAVRAASALR